MHARYRVGDHEPLLTHVTLRLCTKTIATSDFRAAVSDYERALLQNALAANRFNQRATATALNLSYDQLRHALKRHKLLETDAA